MAKSLRTISIPNKIKIGAMDVSIQLQKNLSKRSDDEGGYFEEDQLILLDKDIIESGNRYSIVLLWHEVLHAIYSQYSLEGLSEEKNVSGFSQGIVQVFGDNPKLVNWILKCLKK